MLDREWQRGFEATQREQDRQWQTQQEERAENRHQDQMNTLRSQHRWELIVFGVFVTFLVVASTIAGAFIEGAISAGWIGEPSWWPF